MHLGIDAHLLLRPHATGVERYARFLLRRMMAATPPGVEVTLYAHEAKPAALDVGSWRWKRLSWPLRRGWTHGRLSVEMLSNPPDVLFVPGHEVPLLVRGKTKVVTTLHDVAFKHCPEAYPPSAVRRQDLAVRRALRRADRVLTPSEATKLDLAKYYHIDLDRVTVTHLAPTMPASGRADTLERLHLRPQMFFVFVGRLESKKGVVDLVHAFALLKQRLGHGNPHQLALVGSFGFGGERVKHAIAASGVADDIRVLGFVPDEDVASLLRHALALVMPSHAEGFGIPVVEAMAAGCPVIASDVPALREVCGEACAKSRVADVSSLRDALQRMVFDATMRDKLIADGHERAKAFSWDDAAKKTWEVIMSL